MLFKFNSIQGFNIRPLELKVTLDAAKNAMCSITSVLFEAEISCSLFNWEKVVSLSGEGNQSTFSLLIPHKAAPELYQMETAMTDRSKKENPGFQSPASPLLLPDSLILLSNSSFLDTAASIMLKVKTLSGANSQSKGTNQGFQSTTGQKSHSQPPAVSSLFDPPVVKSLPP